MVYLLLLADIIATPLVNDVEQVFIIHYYTVLVLTVFIIYL